MINELHLIKTKLKYVMGYNKVHVDLQMNNHSHLYVLIALLSINGFKTKLYQIDQNIHNVNTFPHSKI